MDAQQESEGYPHGSEAAEQKKHGRSMKEDVNGQNHDPGAHGLALVVEGRAVPGDFFKQAAAYLST